MAENKFLAALSLIVLFSLFYACNNSESDQQKSVFRQIPEIAEIKPQKPVKIKLKRSANGNYSWELTGDDADRVIQADKKLKGSLGQSE